MQSSTVSLHGELFTVPNLAKRTKMRSERKFNLTNAIWNKYGFNARRIVGSLMELINECKPKSIVEWEEFYFDKFNPTRDFNNVFKKFAKAAGLTEVLAYTYTYIRVIDETFIGYQREVRAFDSLVAYCKNLSKEKGATFTCRKAELDIDVRYAIDAEFFVNGELTVGIQLKSQRYIDIQLKLNKRSAKQNAAKHNAYSKKFKVDSYYLTYETIEKGEMILVPSAQKKEAFKRLFLFVI